MYYSDKSAILDNERIVKSSDFLFFINNFRGIAIIIIVAFHTLYWVKWTENSVSEKVLNTVLMNCTILFIYISGYLFHHVTLRFTYNSYLRKKFINVISPYLIISAPAVLALIFNIQYIPKTWIYSTGIMHKSIICDILVLEITGSQWYHFWFIPMMIIFYLLAPLFWFIINHPKIYICLPFFVLISFLIGRQTSNSNPIHSVLYFMPVYLLGAFSSQFNSQLKMVLNRYWFVILALFFLTSYLIYKNDITSLSLFQKIALCFLLLALMIRLDDFKMTFLRTMAKYSFGIYFIHAYVIYLLAGLLSFLGFKDLQSFGILSYFGFSIMVLLLSYFILRAIKIVLQNNSRMFIGC
jgi:surface polysaccharide O-acyltransferase-like enzyme